MATLLLVYQHPTPKYQGENFIQNLVKFLIKTEEDILIKSSVPFSIYFSTYKPSPLKNWYNLLFNEFGSNFKFTLCIVDQYDNGGDKVEKNEDREFSENFEEFVEELRNGLTPLGV